jgi:hypothetical protein
LFHRDDLKNYLEIFLMMYCKDEEKEIKNEERKNLILYHYFLPFLKPEEYFTIDALNKVNLI